MNCDLTYFILSCANRSNAASLLLGFTMQFNEKVLLNECYLYVACKNHKILHFLIHVCLFVYITDFSWIWPQIYRSSALYTGTGELKLSLSVGLF